MAILIKPSLGTVKIIAPNNNGLSAYYSFEEGAGNILRDYSGNNSNASLINSPNWVDGIKGKALKFNGTNQQTNSSVSCSTTNYTVCGWMKYSGNPSTSNFSIGISFGDGNTGTIWMGLYTNGKITISDSSIDIYGQNMDNNWHFYVATVSGGNITAYLDGILLGSHSISARDSNSLVLGNYVNGSYFWNGLIDNIRVYNRSITQTEITNLYQSGSSKITAPTTVGLVGYWSMDEGIGNIAHDQSGNENHGALVKSPSWIKGIHNGALSFNGINNYINIKNNSIFSFERTNSFSFSAWIKTSSNNNQIIFAKAINTLDAGYYFGVILGKLRLLLTSDTTSANGISIDTINNVTDGKWHHVIATYNGNSNASGVNLYIDRILQSTHINSNALTNSIVNNLNLNIGIRGESGLPFLGTLDEIRIYNRVLTQVEITTLYTSY